MHYYLKKEPLLLISMVVSGMAVLISLFNMVMCVENEFDPGLLEEALETRRVDLRRKQEEENEAKERAAANLKRASTKMAEK